MKTVFHLGELAAELGVRDAVIACGVFDGIHRGHRRIIEALTALAATRDATPVVVTFEPHPRAVLQPEAAPRLLTARAQKLRLLAESGVSAVVLLPFSKGMAAQTPEQFLGEHLLARGVTVHGVCVGAGWKFGAGRRGDTALLQRTGRKLGFEVVSVPEFCLYGVPVSSTRIREAIRRGRLRYAARLLGRHYSVYGHVSHGRGIGTRELHCPTANLADDTTVLPPCGVYAARACLDESDREPRDSVVYVGTAPTIQDGSAAPFAAPVLEIHLFDFDRDLYGAAVEVELLEFIRPDRKFRSVASLRRQIRLDIAAARETIAAACPGRS